MHASTTNSAAIRIERWIRYATAYTATGFNANSTTPTRSAAVLEERKAGSDCVSSGKRVHCKSCLNRTYKADATPRCNNTLTRRCFHQSSPMRDWTHTKLPYDSILGRSCSKLPKVPKML